MTMRLIADVGGTNTKIALYDSGSNEFRALATFTNRDYEDFEDVIAKWLADLKEAAPVQACIAIAAMPSGDTISMTNMDWSFSSKAIAAQFGFTRFRCINDFEGNAFSLPHLTEDDRAVIQAGSSAKQGKLAVLGPGTGLGGATVEAIGKTSHACACEPGYASLAPANDLEMEIFRILLSRYPQIYAELLVSGPGLLRLYKVLSDITNSSCHPQTPAQVSQLALQQGDETAVLALNTFSALLGSIAGDFCLSSGSYGGLYLAGGIVPTMIPFLHESEFLQRFRDKGAMSRHLGEVPVYAITTPQPGLIGAAHAPIEE